MPEQAIDVCAICGEREADRRFLHECYSCGRYYHLNPYTNEPGKDCGDAVLGEEFGLFYYCETCLVDIDDEYRAATNYPRPDAAPATPPDLPPRPAREATRRRYRRTDPS